MTAEQLWISTESCPRDMYEYAMELEDKIAAMEAHLKKLGPAHRFVLDADREHETYKP